MTHRNMTLLSSHWLYRIFAGLALVLLSATSVAPVYGLTPTQQKIFRYQVYNYDDEINTACAAAVGNGTANSDVSTTASQEANAKIVIGIAKTNNLGKEGAFIGLMVAMAESGLKNYANSGVPVSLGFPNEAVGSNYDSVGLFQQRVASAWSTLAPGADTATQRSSSASQAYANKYPDAVKQIMTPAYSAEAFFGSPAGSDAPSSLSKGLQNVSGWQKLDPWVAAQKVQASGTPDGSNYKAYADKAQTLLGKLWDASPAIPLPVALSKAASTDSTVSNSSCVSPCDTSSADASLGDVRQQVICRAQAEYQLWQSGALKPGSDYHKYSQGRDENWCADFASWIYNQAGYPIDPTTKDGNVPAVSSIEDIGQLDKLFHYHAAANYTPKPGDLAIHYSDGRPSHVNIVTAVKGKVVTVIGGNQSTYDFTTSNVSQYDLNTPTSDGTTGYVSPD